MTKYDFSNMETVEEFLSVARKNAPDARVTTAQSDDNKNLFYVYLNNDINAYPILMYDYHTTTFILPIDATRVKFVYKLFSKEVADELVGIIESDSEQRKKFNEMPEIKALYSLIINYAPQYYTEIYTENKFNGIALWLREDALNKNGFKTNFDHYVAGYIEKPEYSTGYKDHLEITDAVDIIFKDHPEIASFAKFLFLKGVKV